MNSKTFLFFILFTLTLLSKEVLVFNEEILVLFAFGTFVFLVYNFASNLISEDLDSRANKIREEFHFYKDIQEKTLSHLILYHNKQKLLSEEIKSIFLILKKDIDIIISSYSKLFSKLFINAVEDKLKKIISSESKLNLILQNKINDQLCYYLISMYTTHKDKKLLESFLLNSITFLSSVK